MADEEVIPHLNYADLPIEDNTSSEEVVGQPSGSAEQNADIDDTEAFQDVTQVEAVANKRRCEESNDEQATAYRKIDNHTKIVASHYNKLEEKGRAERSNSRIFHMRNFNNWIKSILINEFLKKVQDTVRLGDPFRVLDMCCGKGGDLLKWEKSSITHIICTDIAEVSIEHCKDRYNKMRHKPFTAEFFACDSTLQRLREKYKDPSIELNLVSCQFAFHYCFESLKQAECMVRNASECLRTGGYFFGTIPDANEIMKRQQAVGGTEFGNEIYRIKFLCDTDKPPLFGAKYNFELHGVVNCPEFLVHFPLLVKLARKFGLKLVLKERFEDFFERNKNEYQAKSLLERMNALETYPPFNQRDTNESSSSDAYSHVKGYTKGRACGTLSQYEWEAVSLYLVFAFQKMKKQYNDKGEIFYV